MNAGTAQRAGDGDGSRAYSANRHRLWIRMRSFVRRALASSKADRRGLWARHADTHTLMWKHLGRGSIPCAVRRQTHVFAAGPPSPSCGVTAAPAGVGDWCHFCNTSRRALGPMSYVSSVHTPVRVSGPRRRGFFQIPNWLNSKFRPIIFKNAS